MSDEADSVRNDRSRKASPWPVFVAMGVVVAELGVVFGFFPVTVGGLLLFGAAVAGILTEADYVAGPRPVLVVVGVVLAGLGAFAVLGTVGAAGADPAVLLDPTNGVAYRGAAIVAAGVLLVGLGVGLPVGRLATNS